MALALTRWVGRAIGLDVHRDFCVVAICEDGRVRSAGRVPSTPEGLRLLAESLLLTDRVALEVTGSCWEVARILEPFVDRVIVVSPDDTGIGSARAKTDKLDSRTLASLLSKGELDAVSMPDERCRILCRRLARREQLMRALRRSKNGIQAVLQRRLQAKPPFADLFGSRAVSGSPAWSCPSRSASPSTRVCDRSRSRTLRSPRSIGWLPSRRWPGRRSGG